MSDHGVKKFIQIHISYFVKYIDHDQVELSNRIWAVFRRDYLWHGNKWDSLMKKWITKLAMTWWRHRLLNSPHKGQWCGALMFSLIRAWINGWVNNRKAGDLRCHRAHYDVVVMISKNVTLLVNRTSNATQVTLCRFCQITEKQRKCVIHQ